MAAPPLLKSKLILGWLSLAGALVPGLQRFYLKQRIWGVAYLLLGLGLDFLGWPLRGISYGIRALCVIEGLWVLTMSNEDFNSRFNREQTGLEWTSVEGREAQDPEQQLEAMQREGLITAQEYQERRQQLRDLAKPS